MEEVFVPLVFWAGLPVEFRGSTLLFLRTLQMMRTTTTNEPVVRRVGITIRAMEPDASSS